MRVSTSSRSTRRSRWGKNGMRGPVGGLAFALTWPRRSGCTRPLCPVAGAPRPRVGRSAILLVEPRLHSPTSVVHTEPYGSVCEPPTRCLVLRALGRHPTRRSGAARACRRFDHGPCRQVPHDPNGHEEARRRLGAGGAHHHGEGRARADLQARPAPTGGRGGMDREVPPALGCTESALGSAPPLVRAILPMADDLGLVTSAYRSNRTGRRRSKLREAAGSPSAVGRRHV